MTAAYYDTSYLFKLQCVGAGTEEVRAHAATADTLFCSLHGRAEFVSAAHRKVREGVATLLQLQVLLAQMQIDTAAGGLRWLPVSEAHVVRVETVFRNAAPSTCLRAADALHLASAAEQGLTEIDSNDRHLLAAAPFFGLRGVDVVPQRGIANHRESGFSGETVGIPPSGTSSATSCSTIPVLFDQDKIASAGTSGWRG